MLWRKGETCRDKSSTIMLLNNDVPYCNFMKKRRDARETYSVSEDDEVEMMAKKMKTLYK